MVVVAQQTVKQAHPLQVPVARVVVVAKVSMGQMGLVVVVVQTAVVAEMAL